MSALLTASYAYVAINLGLSLYRNWGYRLWEAVPLALFWPLTAVVWSVMIAYRKMTKNKTKRYPWRAD